MALNFDSVGTSAQQSQSYTWQDTALYALALGAGTEDLQWVRNEPAPVVLPTYGVIPAFEPMFEVMKKTGADLIQLLHTAQVTEQISPLPCAGTMTTTATLRGLWDMKIGATAIVDTETSVDGTLCTKTTWELLLRGEGGFRGPRPPSIKRTRVPKPQDGAESAEPLFEVTVPTRREQALLYRLTGDINPIHSDPDIAKAAGFERPILHGLCTYGIAGRIALKELAGDDPARFISLDSRFAKPVLPGDTLVVRGYALAEPGQAALTVTVQESGELPIASALFKYK